MNVLLPTFGSSGDVNPFVALGVALQSRGHRATVLTNPIFQAQVESHGLRFVAIGSAAEARRLIDNPALWHARKGFGVMSQALIPAMEQVFRAIESHADQATVIAFSTLSLGARLAQEKLRIPGASVHLQPSVIRTVGDQGMFGDMRLGAAHPKWFKRLVFRAADTFILDRHLRQPLNRLRAKLGLTPVDRVMHQWLHSPQLIIGFFPPWFAPRQPDWPDKLNMVGFPLWDANVAASAEEALKFLDEGAPPLLFTAGSAGSTMHEFFAQSVEAARRLEMRAMLITNYPDQIPANLPPDIKVFGYIPFSQVMPRAALTVYHGGIGTLAQGIKAAVPHLVVPHAYDQFDSAWRIRRLGLGDGIAIRSYRASRITASIRSVLGDKEIAARCRDYARRVNGAQAIDRAVVLIESLGTPQDDREPRGNR